MRKQNLAARKLVAAQKRNRFLAPAFFAAFGVFFIGQDIWNGHFSWFLSGLGSLFILFAIAMYVATWRWLRESARDGT
jgi:hypothetical protein